MGTIDKYKASKWPIGITKVKCEKETEKTVWVFEGGAEVSSQKAKISDHYAYCDTPEQAADFIMGFLNQQVEIAKFRLKTAMKEVQNFKEYLEKQNG